MYHTTTVLRGDEDIEVEVEYSILGSYIPERLWLPNGDPGYPAEYPELEIYSTSIELTDEEYKQIETEIWNQHQ